MRILCRSPPFDWAGREGHRHGTHASGVSESVCTARAPVTRERDKGGGDNKVSSKEAEQQQQQRDVAFV